MTAFRRDGVLCENPGMRATADTTCTIRPAGLADAEALCTFKRQVFGETEFLLQGLEDFDDHVDAERDLIGRYHHQSNSVLVVAVTDDGRVVGLCSIVGGHLWRTRHVGTMSIGVLRAWWRHGVGKRLMTQTIRWADENPLLEKLTLHVHATNAPARAMYLGLGFVEEGLLRGEAKLGDGEDDLVPMGLRLPKQPGTLTQGLIRHWD
jgi:RimJ/RimL family protein N-acetyltransferase